MNGVLLAARVVLAGVFVVAAVAKLADRAGSRQAVEGFGVPARLAGPVAALLPLAELAAGILLLITGTARIGAGLAVVLFALFCAGITRSIIRGEAPDCHCFGQLHSEPAGPKTLLRNVVLGGVAVLALVGGSGTSATAWAGHLSGGGVAGLVGGLAGAALVAGGLSLFVSLLRRYGQLLLRVDRLEQALVEQGIAVPGDEPEPEGLAPGSPAPELEILDLGGELVSLEALTASGLPVVLTFTDPGCGPCSALLPRIAEWQRQHSDSVRIVLVSRGDVEANLAHAREHGVSDVLLQRDREVYERYQVNGTPSAVLVSPDGTIGSWVQGGADAVSELVGSQLPPRLEIRHSGAGVGQPAPDLALTTLEGRQSLLSDQLEGTTAVLFWNPTCGFCQRMLPDLQRVDQAPPGDAPKIVVVSTGDPEQNREMGLQAPVLLDGSFATGSAFGASGTPSAVLVDDQGRVASGVAVGAPAVLALMGSRPSPV